MQKRFKYEVKPYLQWRCKPSCIVYELWEKVDLAWVGRDIFKSLEEAKMKLAILGIDDETKIYDIDEVGILPVHIS